MALEGFSGCTTVSEADRGWVRTPLVRPLGEAHFRMTWRSQANVAHSQTDHTRDAKQKKGHLAAFGSGPSAAFGLHVTLPTSAVDFGFVDFGRPRSPTRTVYYYCLCNPHSDVELQVRVITTY